MLEYMRFTREGEKMDGIVIIHKPMHMTSHDVVGILRRVLKTKRVGHAGTLDPLATGVLVLGINKGTKLLQFLEHDSKSYRATLKLGVSTTTYDSEGEVVEEKPYQNDVTIAMIQSVFQQFTGTIEQTPPIYSAIKKNGRPLYDYARKGETVEIEKRQVVIESLELLSFEEDTLTFDVACSKGTYIRSLCVDIAKALGYPGMMSGLIRTRSGRFTLEDAQDLEAIKKGVEIKLISNDEALKAMPQLVVEDDNMIIQGKRLKSDIQTQVAIYNQEGHLLAVYEPAGNGELKSVRGLW